MTENRFFRSLFTLTASSVLVGGGLLLLTSTAHFAPVPEAESDPSTPDTMPLAEEPSIEFERPSAEIDQARTNVPDETEADPAITASVGDEPDPVEPDPAVASDAPSAEQGDSVAALETPSDAEPVGAEGMVPDQTPDQTPDPDETANDDSAPDSVAALPAQPEISRAEEKANEASDQIGDLLAELPPRVIASDVSGAATEQVAELLAATPPAPAPVEPEAAPEPVAALPAPPLPKRKPEAAPAAPQQEIAEIPPVQAKPARPEEPKPAPRQEVVQQEPTQPQPKGPWQPMGLAPADQPVPARVPTARPSGAAYASSVWSALARHKPRAGQRGSTTVVFAIGGNGALRALKVGRSSGNARIDQLALATVRSAAPFAPPPSGSASYTIRIDFH
ncbi:MAG TPA: TonB family protein [Devosiaceae bacterium]|nr:TonB family protein [Devosiaceae bacterium]